MATVVVLGASGLLGQALMAELARRCRPAQGLSRRGGADLAALASTAELGRLLDAHQPSLLINAAAITSLEHCEREPAQAWLLHARLPGLLADWSRTHGVPWVQVSTDHYYIGERNTLHDEEAPTRAPNEYARSKLAGEALALTCPHALVARTNIAGRRGWPGQPSFAEWAVAALRGGQAFPAYTDSWASSLAAEQCAEALLDLADLGLRGLLHVAAREATSKAEFIGRLAEALDLDASGLTPCLRPRTGLPRANALGLDVRRAERALGRALPTAAQVAGALATCFEEDLHATA